MTPDPFTVTTRVTAVPGIVDTDWISLVEGIVVLTGRNNVGKSRLLRSIASVSPALPESLREHSALIDVQYGSTSFRLQLDADRRLATFEYEQPGAQATAQWREVGDGGWSLAFSNGADFGNGGHNGQPPPIEYTNMHLQNEVMDTITRIAYLPAHRPVSVLAPATAATETAPDGTNLGQVIFTHRGTGTPEFDELIEEIRTMFPEVRQLLSVPTDQPQVQLSIRDRFTDDVIPVDRAGTGLSQVTLIVASVLFSAGGRIFLIDEPHAYLHPGVERLLVGFMRRHPEHYYVCATHSPVFINAASPEAIWLVTRDEQGTRTRSAFQERLSRSHIFDELGIEPGDVALSERVIFVEGLTEVHVLPILLEKLDLGSAALNCAFVHMKGGDIVRQADHMAAELSRALGVEFMILLDGDKKQDHGGHRHVGYLDVPEIEDLFLADSHALLAGLMDALRAQDHDASEAATRGEWTVERVNDFISHHRTERGTPEKPVKASDLIRRLAFEMGLNYSKPTHGPMIARHLSAEAADPLRSTLEPFLKSEKDSTE